MYSFKALLSRILKYIKKYRFLMFLALLSSIIFVFATLYAPYIIGHEIINLFTPSFKLEQLFKPFIKVAIVTIFAVLSGIIMGILLNKATYNIIKDIQIDTFDKLLTLPVSYLDSNSHGDILSRVTSDVDRVWDGLLHGFTHIFRGIVAIILTIVFMLISKWELALLVILLTPLSLIVSTLIAKKSHSSFAKRAKINGQMVGLTNEMISEQKTVIAYMLNEENNKKYQALDAELYDVGVKAQFIASFSNPSTRLCNAIVYASVALYGTILIVLDPSLMNVGKLSIFLFFASQYTRPFNEISAVFAELSNSFASLKRVFELIDEKDYVDNGNKEVKIKNNEFKIDCVNFSYNENKQILKDISFDVLANKKVAIVGPTGCGKTTLINLLMRYYDVNEGKILLDDKNIESINKSTLRSHVGMVLQDTWLFKGSVKENIKYGNYNASDEDVFIASKAANCYDFINKLPKGFDTIIDNDEGLSIGQKQLICIARLMIKLPNILILDEATSNIDTRTEVKVQRAFDLLMEGRTSIVIAHRLSTIRHADLIIVMKDGSIIEQGNHDKLMKQNGFYKELYNSI